MTAIKIKKKRERATFRTVYGVGELDWKAKFNYRGELSRVRVNTREISLARKKHFATEKVPRLNAFT